MLFERLALRALDGSVISYTVVDDEYNSHELAAAWLHDLRFGRDCSLNTVSKYAADLAHFLTWAVIAAHDIVSAPAHMSGYMYLLRTQTLPKGQRGAGRPRKPGRSNDILVAVRSFYDWAIDAGRVDERAEKQLWRRRGKDREARHRFREETVENREVISGDDVVKLVAAADNIRDRFLIVLLRYTGTRIGQLLGLRLQDLHLREDNSIYDSADGTTGGCAIRDPHIHRLRREDNPNGATSKARHRDWVPVPPIVLELYLRYLPWRDNLPGANNTSMLLLNADGHALGRSYPNSLLTRLSSRARVRHCTPHMFRHTFATALREGGAELDTIQRLLGQRSPKSVQIYNHIPDQTMRDAVESIAALQIDGE